MVSNTNQRKNPGISDLFREFLVRKIFLIRSKRFLEARLNGPKTADCNPIEGDLLLDLFGNPVRLLEKNVYQGIEGRIQTNNYYISYYLPLNKDGSWNKDNSKIGLTNLSLQY